MFWSWHKIGMNGGGMHLARTVRDLVITIRRRKKTLTHVDKIIVNTHQCWGAGRKSRACNTKFPLRSIFLLFIFSSLPSSLPLSLSFSLLTSFTSPLSSGASAPNAARGVGKVVGKSCKLLNGSRRSPAARQVLVYFQLKEHFWQ